jgi:LuxR family transcriptional regulator, maltose regulon positive regulatory protein
MTRKAPQLAKLTRPRLHKAVARERLFELLDEKREHPVVWIVGPPGAGKTTLAASYLEETGAPAIWYQIDPGDSDPATFFFYLKQAIESAARKKGKPLPLLTPEYLPDLPGFARRFLRDGFARLPEDVVLVFDNYHDIAPDSALHGPFKAALAEVPPGSNVMVLGRTDPPPAFADAIVNQTISSVTWEELRLTPEETTAIGASRGITDKAILRTLHDQSTGWMAGATLMLERLRGGASLETLSKSEAMDTVFNYFAGLIFDRAPDETKDVLLKTAFLPLVTASLVEAVTGTANAIEHIEDLHHRHLFTDRVGGTEVSYQFHALFRDFLRSRAQASLRSHEFRALLTRTGELLFDIGDFEASFELGIKAQQWETARRIAVTQAAELLRQGRSQTLIGWLNVLRREDFETDPWLSYWRGLAEMSTDALKARTTLTQTYRQFANTQNKTGQLLAAASILDSYFLIWNTVSSMDAWISEVEALIRDDRPVSNEARRKSNASILIALLYRQPCNPILHIAARKVEIDLEEETDPTQKLKMYAGLIHYFDLMGEFSRARIQIGNSEALRKSEQLAPLMRAVTWVRVGQHFTMTGEHEEALKATQVALDITHAKGLSESIIGFFVLIRAHAQMAAGRLKEATCDFQEGRNRIDASNSMVSVYAYWLEFWIAVCHGERSQTRGLWEAFSKVPYVGVPFNTAYNLPVVYFLAQEGQLDEVRKRLQRWRSGLAGMGSAFIDFNLDLMESYAELRSSDEERAVALLRRAFGTASAHGFLNNFAWIPSMMSELCVLAFKRGIETDYISRLIKSRNLLPADLTLEAWPWPVRVYVLGKFVILKRGEQVTFRGRPQHRTLELLKTIIGFGGTSVTVSRVLSVLWPDADGDAAQAAFTVALHRLRKLLGDECSLRLSDGVISIDQSYCWVDAIVFEKLADAAQSAHAANSMELGRRLTVMYQGHLFGDDESAPWLLPMRERMRSKCRRAVQAVGDALEQRCEWDHAVDLYRKVTEVDPLAEEFYRRVMVCRKAQGRFAEAMDAYRRCRDIFSIVLGVAPSTETQQLFRSIQACASARADSSSV